MKYKVQTLNKPNISDFAKERNDLLQKSETDWNLFLDLDETISNFQFPISNQFSCYQFPRKNFFLGQFVGTDKIIRLVKKGTGKFVRRVHEVWKPNNPKLVGLVDTPIIHNTSDNLKDYLYKINNY